VTWFLLVGLLVLLALNVPVAFAMLTTSVLYLAITQEVPLIVVAQQVGAGTDKFLLLAIPFFFLAAEFMNTGGIMHRLVDLASAMVGHIRGGLGHVNVVASMLFADMSGSAVADAAGMGRIEIEMMRKSGYPLAFSGAITAASATIGPVIPPSIPFVVYGSLAGVSVGKLFLAGVIPGVAMGLFLMGSVWVLAGRRNFPTATWAGFGHLGREFVHALPVLALPVIILGGIFSGVFTATESAIVAAAYALLIGLLLREVRLTDIVPILIRVGTDSARIMMVVVAATLYSWILAREGAPQAVAGIFLGLTDQPWLLLLLINVLLLLLGCFMEPLPIMVIVVPTMLPLVQALGIDLVHFGVIVTLNLMIGLITPPIGIVMFTVMEITKVPIESFTRAIWPFFGALVLALALITYVPGLVLFLPELIYGQ
jgi:C4-dicarboxylate transporter DctM subunit